MSSITLSQVKYVLALHKTGSFSEAADLCFITQSTLSTMIKKLEYELDLEIFNRKSKPISLTHEGNALISHFKVLYHEYENLLELVQETKEEFYGTLKIGIIPTIAPFLLPLFLDRFVEMYPNINFYINEITTNEITKKIMLREIDIGIMSIPLKHDTLNQKSLYVEDFVVYDVREQGNKSKRYKIKDIDVSRLWLLEESHCLTTQIKKICHLKSKISLSNNLVFRSGSILSLLELVNMNKGLTLLPRMATFQKNLIHEKHVYELSTPVPVREIGIVTHPNFAKKRLLTILEKEIINAVKPILKKNRKKTTITPF